MTPEELYLAPPTVHADDTGRVHGEWALGTDTLRLIERSIEPGARTLETGAGLSSVLFALLGAEHTVITPDPLEESRIRAFCAERAITTAGLRFIIGGSQEVLPRLADDPLDLVLLDGSHAFPVPFLDWYHTASRLRVGGLLIVDDTQLWTGRTLCDFLSAEPGWLAEGELERSAAFRKSAPIESDPSWVRQPYVTSRSLAWDGARWSPYSHVDP